MLLFSSLPPERRIVQYAISWLLALQMMWKLPSDITAGWGSKFFYQWQCLKPGQAQGVWWNVWARFHDFWQAAVFRKKTEIMHHYKKLPGSKLIWKCCLGLQITFLQNSLFKMKVALFFKLFKNTINWGIFWDYQVSVALHWKRKTFLW